MNIERFIASLSESQPPKSLSIYLRALWYDAKGEWHKAHEEIQDVPDKKASWIHAYLHRKEGDTWNANYWYNKAGRNMPGEDLKSEWEYITKEMLPT
ncbi:MAG TPA: hypothetical protein PKM63_11960 [Panacibacter sp.]|nr:hypothetical protein [Panacibacter sp.]HNP44995.1 hypothetical protein [Panacibacter sp.]